MDISRKHTDPGTEIISFPKKDPKTDDPTNQLWTKSYVDDEWFYIVSKLDDKKIAIEVCIRCRNGADLEHSPLL